MPAGVKHEKRTQDRIADFWIEIFNVELREYKAGESLTTKRSSADEREIR
jgi:hypothetical protein